MRPYLNNIFLATKNANPFVRGDGFPLLMGMLPGMGGGNFQTNNGTKFIF